MGTVVHHMSEPVALEAMFFSSLVCLIMPFLLSRFIGLHSPRLLLAAPRDCPQRSDPLSPLYSLARAYVENLPVQLPLSTTLTPSPFVIPSSNPAINCSR